MLAALTRLSKDFSASHINCPSCGQELQFARTVRGTGSCGFTDLRLPDVQPLGYGSPRRTQTLLTERPAVRSLDDKSFAPKPHVYEQWVISLVDETAHNWRQQT